MADWTEKQDWTKICLRRRPVQWRSPMEGKNTAVETRLQLGHSPGFILGRALMMGWRSCARSRKPGQSQTWSNGTKFGGHRKPLWKSPMVPSWAGENLLQHCHLFCGFTEFLGPRLARGKALFYSPVLALLSCTLKCPPGGVLLVVNICLSPWFLAQWVQVFYLAQSFEPLYTVHVNLRRPTVDILSDWSANAGVELISLAEEGCRWEQPHSVWRRGGES